MQLAESLGRVEERAGSLLVVRDQEITKDFLDDIHSERMAKASLRYAEHDRVASIPTSVVDLWMAQGVPFYDLTAREIVARLDREGLNAFITTDRAV